MNTLKIKTLLILIGTIIGAFYANAQYSCATAIVIPSIPYNVSNLTTSSGASYTASGFCGQNTNYDEQDYIFEYTPTVDEFLNLNMSHNNFLTKCGIYVFTDCAQPPIECVAFSEGFSSTELSFVANAGQQYYIFIGTATMDNFSFEMNKEEIEGIAINKSAATQTLDVNGAIRIGENTTTPYAGTIRWNVDSGEFEGYTGTEWVSLSPKKEFGYPANFGNPNTASDGAENDEFGYSVSISGDNAIVGAYKHDTNANQDQGKAYIFHRVGENWIEEAILIASDGAEYDVFGYSVSISGDYAVVGAYAHDTNGNENQGKAYIYKRSGTTWTQEAILTASDGAEYDGFGGSVSISGDYAVVGAWLHDTNGNENQGKAYIYKRSGITWTQEAILTASDGATGDLFGYSVSISGDYAVVGAYAHDINGNQDQGKAYIYKRSGTTWTQEAILSASDGAARDEFGRSVSISGYYAIVGAPDHDTNGKSEQGKAYIYKRSGTTWTQETILVASDSATFDVFGRSVSISGDYAIVGASNHDTNGNDDQGKAYIYKRSGTTWTQEGILTSSDGAGLDYFGRSVSISGDNAIVGAFRHNTFGIVDRGKVYFY